MTRSPFSIMSPARGLKINIKNSVIEASEALGDSKIEPTFLSPTCIIRTIANRHETSLNLCCEDDRLFAVDVCGSL